jgi:hypothetical protein
MSLSGKVSGTGVTGEKVTKLIPTKGRCNKETE